MDTLLVLGVIAMVAGGLLLTRTELVTKVLTTDRYSALRGERGTRPAIVAVVRIIGGLTLVGGAIAALTALGGKP
jgi:hypothetical protein